MTIRYLCGLLTISFMSFSNTQRIITLPPLEDYKPLPAGQVFFSITNNNSQHISTVESKREVQTHITPPPIVINTTPPPEKPTLHSEPLQNTSPKTKTASTNYSASFLTFFKDFPSTITTWKAGAVLAGTVVALYGFLWIPYLRHTFNAKKNTGWGAFQEHISLYHLSSLPVLTLADGLLEEIKKRYPLTDATNLMPSLFLFNKDVEEEFEALTNFLAFYERLSDYKLALFFPGQKKLVSQAKLRIQRLSLFKEAISQWLHTHLVKNRKTSQDASSTYFKPMLHQAVDAITHEL